MSSELFLIRELITNSQKMKRRPLSLTTGANISSDLARAPFLDE